jgi:hypothetical protein
MPSYTDQNGNAINALVTDQASNRGLQGGVGGNDLMVRVLIELQVISHILAQDIRVSEDLTALRNDFATSLFTGA